MEINLEIHFHDQDKCSCFMETNISDPVMGKIGELTLFCFYTLRQMSNCDQGDFCVGYAGALRELADAGVNFPLVIETGETKFVQYPGVAGRKQFICRLYENPNKVLLFDLKAKGFGFFARGVGSYAAMGSIALMNYFAKRRAQDRQFLELLARSARRCSEAYLSGIINPASNWEVAQRIAGEAVPHFCR